MEGLIREKDGWLRCSVHSRLLSYKEWQAKTCWWCNPLLSPPKHKIRDMSSGDIEKLKHPVISRDQDVKVKKKDR